MSRVFQPKLSNPLHANDSESTKWHQSAPSPVRPILKVKSSAMPHVPLLTAKSQAPIMPSRGLHDPVPAPDVWVPSHMSPPDTTTVSLHNAMDQDEPVNPIYAPASLEDITRMNLIYLMTSKGIIVAPHFTAPQVSSHHPLHQSQQIPPASYTNTTQPSTSCFIATNTTRDEEIENDPVTTTTDDSASYMSEDDSTLQPQSRPPPHSSKSSRRHRIVLSQSLKTNTPLFPKHNPKPPLTKPRIFEWANGLNRLWYLLEQHKYSQNDHDQLRSLLRNISREKDRPGLGLMWLKDTKLIEILKRFKKDKTLQEFDPWVRRTAGEIIQFWRGQFMGIPGS